jgi:hypothetical protein
MSTRSIVARVAGDGFEGRYCHWDGYPTNRAKQLFQAYRELGNSADALKTYAIRDGESGYWSSFQPPSEEKKPAHRETPEGEAEFQKNLGEFSWCFEKDNYDLVKSWGDNWGTEWAYVIDDKGLSVFDYVYAERPEGFKYDDSPEYKTWRASAHWHLVGTYKWDEEPDWEEVERYNWTPEEREEFGS